MQVRAAVLCMMLMISLLLGILAVPGIAAQDDTKEVALPRSFQGVHLGMRLFDLVAAVPDVSRVLLNRQDSGARTIAVRSKDRHVQRVEYRFYDNRLRELVIYRNEEVPGGYQRLRDRLREFYGKPLVEDQKEEGYEQGLAVMSVRKTIWKDRATMSSLAEMRNIVDDTRKLILTITDLNLEQAFEEDQAQRRRQRELSIPIPLPDHSIQNRQEVISGSEHARNGHTRG